MAPVVSSGDPSVHQCPHVQAKSPSLTPRTAVTTGHTPRGAPGGQCSVTPGAHWGQSPEGAGGDSRCGAGL